MPPVSEERDPYIERRQDYPDLLAEMIKLRHELEHQRQMLQTHIWETKELTDLWMGSRWFLNALKFTAVTAGTLAGGWLALKHLVGPLK